MNLYKNPTENFLIRNSTAGVGREGGEREREGNEMQPGSTVGHLMGWACAGRGEREIGIELRGGGGDEASLHCMYTKVIVFVLGDIGTPIDSDVVRIY